VDGLATACALRVSACDRLHLSADRRPTPGGASQVGPADPAPRREQVLHEPLARARVRAAKRSPLRADHAQRTDKVRRRPRGVDLRQRRTHTHAEAQDLGPGIGADFVAHAPVPRLPRPRHMALLVCTWSTG
jgi:hypothetical protein